jgi:hypothetical protein
MFRVCLLTREGGFVAGFRVHVPYQPGLEPEIMAWGARWFWKDAGEPMVIHPDGTNEVRYREGLAFQLVDHKENYLSGVERIA